jgi:F-type H+-transporting ATPase subunit b
MGTATSAAYAAGGEAGLPQLKIGTWPSQLFWLVVIFAIGYVFMARVVTPRIGSVLEERRTRLDEDLTRAREASAEAAQTRADYEASLEDARNEAAEFARSAATEAQDKADAAEKKAAKRMATKIGKAETALGEARAEAESNLTAIAAEAAMDAATQIAGVKVTKAQADKAVKATAKTMVAQEAG